MGLCKRENRLTIPPACLLPLVHSKDGNDRIRNIEIVVVARRRENRPESRAWFRLFVLLLLVRIGFGGRFSCRGNCRFYGRFSRSGRLGRSLFNNRSRSDNWVRIRNRSGRFRREGWRHRGCEGAQARRTGGDLRQVGRGQARNLRRERVFRLVRLIDGVGQMRQRGQRRIRAAARVQPEPAGMPERLEPANRSRSEPEPLARHLPSHHRQADRTPGSLQRRSARKKRNRSAAGTPEEPPEPQAECSSAWQARSPGR